MADTDRGDEAATAIEREGFARVTPALLDRDPPHDPETYWQTGFSFPAVGAGYAYPREAVVEDLVESLAAGESRLLVGRAGAGKSTVCKLVAARWLDGGRGPVYHTDASVPTPLSAFDAVVEELRSADGHALVVVEGALDAENHAALELVAALADADGASFLLEARRAKVEEFEARLPGDRDEVVERLARLRGGPVTDYEMPGLDADTCEEVVEFYESVTGATVVRSPAAIYEAVRSGRGIGGDEMLHLGYALTASATDDGESGLERSVRRAFERFEDPPPELWDGGDALGRVALLVNVCNAAGLPIRVELLHALDEDHAVVDAAVDALTGELLFADGDGRYRTNHAFWSGLYVRHLVTTLPDDAARERFGEAVNALLRLADPAVRGDVEEWFDRPGAEESGDRPGARGSGDRPASDRPGSGRLVDAGGGDAGSYLTGVLPVANLVTRIGEFGLRWPVLAPVFGATGDSPIDLPERASAATESAFRSHRGRMHRRAGDLEAALAEFERARERIEAADVPDGTATKIGVRYHNDVGTVELERGDIDAAAEHFERALAAAREVGYRRGEAAALSNLGDVARKRGDTARALERYEESIERSKAVGDHDGVAAALSNLGTLHYRRGAIDDAVDAYEEAIRIYRELGDRSGEAACLNNLGVISQRRDDFAAARRYHRESLEVSQQVGEPLGEAKSLNNLGIVARNRGKFEDAADYFERSLEIKREVGNREGVASSLGNLGVVARMQGDLDEAEGYHRESLRIYGEIGHESERARALMNLGSVNREAERYDDAVERFREAIDAYEGVGDVTGVVRCIEELGRTFEAAGDDGAALDAYERAVRTGVEADHLPTASVVVDAIDLAEELGESDRARAICDRVRPLVDDADDPDGREALRERCLRYR